ncbi:hypothetical protein BYT27DRAFT_7249306 [Phlegmacium glaucopus]|nr:hypothetical protein BYT27DRAFT_7249306 [Phlegmacium glaucopus]
MSNERSSKTNRLWKVTRFFKGKLSSSSQSPTPLSIDVGSSSDNHTIATTDSSNLPHNMIPVVAVDNAPAATMKVYTVPPQIPVPVSETIPVVPRQLVSVSSPGPELETPPTQITPNTHSLMSLFKDAHNVYMSHPTITMVNNNVFSAGGTEQTRYDGDYEIKSAANGQTLGVNDQNQLFESASMRRVNWTMERRGSDTHVIGDASDARAIQLPRNGPVTAETRNNQDHQRRVIEPDPLSERRGEWTGFPTGKFRIRAVGTSYYWTPTRRKTFQDGNTIHVWRLGREESQSFFVNPKGNLSCGINGAQIDVIGNALITTLDRQRTEPYPNPWSHPLPTFSYSAKSKMITIKFYADPVVSNSWPRAESEWRDKEFALAARSVVGTIIPSFQEIARWAPVSAQSTIRWVDTVGYERPARRAWENFDGENKDPSNVDALWDRAPLAKEIGDFRTALAILKRFPYDLTVRRELHTILVELSDLSTCATLLRDALTHYITIYPSGQGKDSASGLVIPAGGFSQMDLLLLADLYNVLGQHERAIETIRRGTRLGEGGPVQAGKFILDPNARHRLAVARIKMGDVEEGKFNNCMLMLFSPKTFLNIPCCSLKLQTLTMSARCTQKRSRFINYWVEIQPLVASKFFKTETYMRNVEELHEAANVYEHVRLADPSNNDVKMKLAEIYEIMGEPRKALDLVYEVIDSRKKRGKSNATNQTEDTANPANTSLFPEDKGTQKSKAASIRAQNRLTRAQLRALEVQKEKEVRDEELVRDKSVKPISRDVSSSSYEKREETEADEDRMASRLQLDLERDSLARKLAKSGHKGDAVDDFRGVSFDDWLRLFMQYCFVLTKQDQYETADEILRHIMVSNAYQAKERQDSIRLALMSERFASPFMSWH